MSKAIAALVLFGLGIAVGWALGSSTSLHGAKQTIQLPEGQGKLDLSRTITCQEVASAETRLTYSREAISKLAKPTKKVSVSLSEDGRTLKWLSDYAIALGRQEPTQYPVTYSTPEQLVASIDDRGWREIVIIEYEKRAAILVYAGAPPVGGGVSLFSCR